MCCFLKKAIFVFLFHNLYLPFFSIYSSRKKKHFLLNILFVLTCLSAFLIFSNYKFPFTQMLYMLSTNITSHFFHKKITKQKRIS